MDTIAVREREIGPLGTAVRVALAFALLVPGALGAYEVAELAFGLVVLPAALIMVTIWRAQLSPTAFRISGWMLQGFVLALLLTPWYAPGLRFTSDGVLAYLGVAMVVALIRGQGGCEVMAIPNWLLDRHDRLACPITAPADSYDRS
jgi:hypothetical protein